MNRHLRLAAFFLSALGPLTAWAQPPYVKQLIANNGGFGVTTGGEWLMVGQPEFCIVHVYKLDYSTMLYGDGNGNAGAVFQNVVAGNFACPSVKNRGFGEVVSLDGNLLVVGAPLAKGPEAEIANPDEQAGDDGTVFLYVYDGTSWSQLAQSFEARNGLGGPLLQASTDQAGAEFGSAVAIDGDLMAIGSRAEGTNAAGSIYFYRVNRTNNTALQIAKVIGEHDGDAMGSSVTIWTNQVLAGVPGYDVPAPPDPPIVDGGAAYLYEMGFGGASADEPVLRDLITANVSGFAPPLNVGKEVSNGEFIGLLAGQASYPLERDGFGTIAPKFEYTRSNGGDVSQSEGVSVFGVAGEGVDIYPDVLNDNATQSANYHLQIQLNGGVTSPGMADDIKIYKDFVAVNENTANRVQVLQFPCNYGGELHAGQWELVTVPCNVPPGTTVEQAFNGDIVPGLCGATPCGILGLYGPNWVVWGQNSDFTSPQPTVRLNANALVQPGKGYWIRADASKKPPGQPVYWNVDNTIFGASPEAARIPLTTGTNPRGGALAPDVGGYYSVDLPDNIPEDQTVGVLLGNPFGRSFRWSQVYVQAAPGPSGAFPVGSILDASPLASIAAYIYDPDITEGQPYVAVPADTPGFSDEIPVNKGFWIRMRHTAGAIFTSLSLPYSK